jgi:hypothetical protein
VTRGLSWGGRACALTLALLGACAPGVQHTDDADGGSDGDTGIAGACQDGGAVASTQAPQGPPKPPAEVVRQVFASRQYPFCHEPDYPLTPGEKRWCDLGAASNTKACPTFKEACKNAALAKQFELREPMSFHFPELGLPLRLVLWILLGLGVAMLVFALVRHFLDHKSKDEVVRTGAATSTDDEAAAALARQVETDVQRLLERARAEAHAGDFRAAIGSAYAALLRRLEGAGLVTVAADQTNGDYVRKLKTDRPAISRRVEEVVDSVELVQFGDHQVTREGFEGVFGRVTALLAERMALLLVLVGLALWGAACGQPRDDWDHSPSGRAGVVQYLGKRGFKVHERLLSLTKIGDTKADQLVLLPGAQVGKDEWKAVETWLTDNAASLVIAGGNRKLPDWVGMRIVDKEVPAVRDILASDAQAARWDRPRGRVPEGNMLESKPEHDVVLVRGKAAYAAEAWIGDEDDRSRILVLADDHLFRNASLLVADNAALLDHLLRDGGTTIELVGDLAGLVSSNPVESVQRGRLGPAMLQLSAFLLIFFVAKGARFGRPVESERTYRREFTEHVRAVGLHYARAHAERHALGLLGAYAVERLRERVGLRVDRSLSGLAEVVAARTGRNVGEVMRMLVEANDASKGVPAEKGARDLETVAELGKLLEETGGSRGHRRIQDHV